MKKKYIFRLARHQVRPCIYLAATRFGAGMLVCVLWHRFANPNQLSLTAYGCFFMAAFFLVMSWLSFLRIDGMHMPQLNLGKLFKKIKKSPMRSFADMSDYTDEEVISFDDLDDDDKNQCLLIANLACALIFLIISFL